MYAKDYGHRWGLNFFPRLSHRLNAMWLVGEFANQQPLSTQNLAVRKKAYQQAGGFNPAITSPLGLDDVDLTLAPVCSWPGGRVARLGRLDLSPSLPPGPGKNDGLSFGQLCFLHPTAAGRIPPHGGRYSLVGEADERFLLFFTNEK